MPHVGKDMAFTLMRAFSRVKNDAMENDAVGYHLMGSYYNGFIADGFINPQTVFLGHIYWGHMTTLSFILTLNQCTSLGVFVQVHCISN